ncbi:branched-chain amino acid ABC transporter permease [Catenulispora rubra]|uniref:branched-chain amino acid ABC transporter permease n=1 Tax=Catenulispora rubra TaxID=280293 RepID=UPI001E65A7BF|nr:branched-chain amino acid ABC transporter permease [Catenulispora rubra]
MTTSSLIGQSRNARHRVGRRTDPLLGKCLIALGSVGALGSTFLAWTWTSAFPGNLTVTGYPGGNQLITLILSILTLLALGPALGTSGVPGTRWMAPRGCVRLLRGLTLANALSTLYVVVAIAWELGGVANYVAGSWVAGISVVLPVVGARLLPDDDHESAPPKPAARAIQILVVFAVVMLGLFVADFGVTTGYSEEFIGFCLAAGFAGRGLAASGLFERFSALTAANRIATSCAVLAAAVLFAFLQSTDAYTSVADNILIFATVALGLNIVVGLAGLLDLGYVAFLGVGAYTAALVSGTAASRYAHVVLPFWAQALIGVAVSVLAGLLIGAPTLRLRGDYLAIVTLGFGEIFRITMNNLDGQSGPQVTNGAEGVYGVPNLRLFGYDFGQRHTVLGHTFGRFGNYYLLLVFVIAVVIFIFARVNDSRIGRAWAAIREDETAAEAMGVHGYRFKLLAFGLGAGLAGLAGSIQGHLTSTVTPDQYTFSSSAPPNSAFLLAAVVLGGMGTISGPLLGASLLFLIPDKLQFFNNKQLLLFGIALIVMMRLRPEGLVPDKRRRLEFHERETSAEEPPELSVPDEVEAEARA